MAHLKTVQHNFKDKVDPDLSTLILIGPAGGFSEEEIAKAESVSF